MRPADLDRRIGWELKQLPGVRAPITLLPRVMQIVNAWASRPWYEQPWFNWPLRMQVASVASLVMCVVALALWLQGFQAAAGHGMSTWATRLVPGVSNMADRLETALLATRVLWRTLVHPMLVYVCVVVVIMTVACATASTALNRAIFGRAIHP